MIQLISACLLVFATSVSAATIDRREMALAAHKIFPHLLKMIENQDEFNQLTPEQRAVFIKVRELTQAREIPLRFNERPEDFDLNEGEARRWMRTTESADGAIEINLSLLNSSAVNVTLPLLLKTGFHERGHKIGVDDWGLRDSVAQFFENQVARYVRQYKLDEETQLTVLSVPTGAVQVELEETSINRPQPTNILLLERGEKVTDLTQPLLQSLEVPSGMLRSIFAQANHKMYEFLEQINQVFAHVAAAIFRGFFGDQYNDNAIEAVKKLRELRILEIQDVEAIKTAPGTLVRMKANYIVGRSMRKHMHIEFGEHMNIGQEYPAPITVLLNLPAEAQGERISAANFISILRPETDLMKAARVSSVQRDPLGRVQTLELRLPQLAAEGELRLVAATDNGQRFIRVAANELLASGERRVRFEIPWRMLGDARVVVAESVQIGTHKGLFLDRLISLASERAENNAVMAVPENALVENSLGFWGRQNEKPVFLTNFRFDEPIVVMDNLRSEHKGFSFSDLVLEFETEREEKVREIHFYYRRMAATVDLRLTDEERAQGQAPPVVKTVNWFGKDVAIASGGNLMRRKDLQEIASLDVTEIYRTETSRGTQKVRASFALPFVPIDDVIKPNEAYIPPMIHPVMVEIVLESGQVLRRAFGELMAEPKKCEDLIQPRGTAAPKTGS